MSGVLIERLQRLERGHSALCASQADAQALYDQAMAFRSAAGSSLSRGSDAEVSRWAGRSAAEAVALGGTGLPKGPVGGKPCMLQTAPYKYHIVCLQGNGGPAAPVCAAERLAQRS